MSESRIDHVRARFDPSVDMMMTHEQSIKFHKDRIAFTIRLWHKYHDAPPEGYGLDWYPLMKGKRRDDP